MILEMMGMNVLVKKIAEPDMTKGGIIMPQTRQQDGPLMRAEVLGVGPGELQYGEMVEIKDLTAGDTVVIDLSYARPFQVQDMEEPCFILSYKDVLAKEKSKKPS